MSQETIVIHAPGDIPQFTSDAEEAGFWDHAEFADDFPRYPVPPDLEIPVDPYRYCLPGDALRSMRQQAGLTQEELARALGITPATVSRWERGKSTVRPAPMVRLALERLIEYERGRQAMLARYGQAS